MSEEKKYKSVLEVDDELLEDLSELIKNKSDAALKNILADLYDFDIAVIIDNLEEDDSLYLFSLLNDETAAEVLLEINEDKKEYITEKLSGEKITDIVSEMYSDDATDFVGELDKERKDEILENLDKLDKEDYHEVKELLSYDENTAGGIMAKEFISVYEDMSIAEAIREIQEQADRVDQLYNVWVVNLENKLTGIISLKRIIIALKNPEELIKNIMNPDVISVDVGTDQEEVAKIFQSYDLVSVPVVDFENRVIGKISIDDVVDVIEEEYSENVARMTGTDAEELEKKSPFEIAKLRLPWLLITLLIELMAVFVVKFYDDTIGKILLLAAFMPIISAISGNTGLQSAAIVVRGIDTGNVNLNKWWEPLLRQFKTNLLIGTAIALVIGFIGFMISDVNRFLFGLSVGLSMFISINIAGIIGTISPMISKKLGFDPALTSGPFETAFQDVIGITIFMTVATFLLTHTS
ncbi:MAG: Magnesium transporter MgtE [Ignavibacteria bacterium]|nr:Magnesium transporter MgtE [Ignavibacteria bacterium]